MALFKYDGPIEEVEVRIAGNDVGIVAKGGSIVVPDELADLTEWPDYWTRVDQRQESKTPPEKVTPEVPAEEKE